MVLGAGKTVSFGIPEGAAAAVAHKGHRRRSESERGQVLLEAIGNWLKQRAMRWDADP